MKIFGPFYGSLTVTRVQEDHPLLFVVATAVVVVVEGFRITWIEKKEEKRKTVIEMEEERNNVIVRSVQYGNDTALRKLALPHR